MRRNRRNRRRRKLREFGGSRRIGTGEVRKEEIERAGGGKKGDGRIERIERLSVTRFRTTRGKERIRRGWRYQLIFELVIRKGKVTFYPHLNLKLLDK